MSTRRELIFRDVFAVVVIAAVMCAVPAVAAARVWTIDPTPNLGTADNCLWGVSGTGSGGVWAVGAGDSGQTYCGGRALIAHRIHGHWRTVPVGGLKGWPYVQLYDVVALSSDDAWAVGRGFSPNFGPERPIIEHWDGSAWNRLPVDSGYRLNAIARVPGTGHLWTVGMNNNDPGENLAGYWNGHEWRLHAISAPTLRQRNDLNLFTAVAATSEQDVWAIASVSALELGSVDRTYAEHWNGKRWTLVWLPGSKTLSPQLFDADNVPHTTQVWAVGRYTPPSGTEATLTERYSHGDWQIVPSPDRGIRSELASVVAIRPGNVWAVGTWYGRKYHSHTLIEHYTHGRWIIVPSPNTSNPDNTLNGLAAVPHNGRTLLWAVGQSGGDRPERTLVMRGW
jgi:hypothetical protein